MGTEGQLLLLIMGVHLLGLACVAVLMIPALRDQPAPPWRADSDSDDGGGGRRERPPERPRPPRGGLPLPEAVQSRVRLRDHQKLGDRLPPHPRRPAREPERTPIRIATGTSHRRVT